MKNRKILFRLFAVLLPFFMLVLLELFLRIFNLFPEAPLFHEKLKNGEAVIEINSSVGKRYFNEKKIPVPTLYPQTFSQQKSDNTFRIFCLGGSTTAGFPYEINVPFPQQLKFLLEEELPDMNIEVVNMGLSAINSFTVLDWIPEILEHEPDLILIYMGHNEYYGAYGTGSTISFGNNGSFSRFILHMNKFHLIQMLRSIIDSFAHEASLAHKKTLMEEIIENKSIPLHSGLREKTLINFSDNLELILQACQENETSVIVSNVVSNIKDQPPLGGNSKAENDSLSARQYYEKGLIKLEEEDSLNAFILLTKAKDLDDVPFRAGEQLNRIIREKALKYNIGFVDMLEEFRTRSPLRIPGENLFCDHLHPNPRGYHMMATQFYKAIKSANFPFSKNLKTDSRLVPLFVTGLDWEIGQIKIFKLKQRWPFANKEVDFSQYVPYENNISANVAKSFVVNHRIWGKAHSEMADYYIRSGNYAKACREYEAIIAIYPQRIDFHKKLIYCAKRTGSWSLVENTCKKALTLTQNKGLFFIDLALAQRMSKRLNEAIYSIQKAINSPELNKEELAQAFYYYAILLKDKGEISDAKGVLRELLQQMPEFAEAKKLLNKL